MIKVRDIKKRVVITCRSVESEIRRENIERIKKETGALEYEAFAGRMLGLNSTEKDRIHKTDVGKAAVALYISHICLWNAVKAGEHMLVLESDAKVVGNLEDLELPEIDFIYLDYQTVDEFMGRAARYGKTWSGNVRQPINPLRTHAYVISGAGAAKMKGMKRGLNMPFDWALHMYLGARGVKWGGLVDRNVIKYIDDVSTVMINGIKQ